MIANLINNAVKFTERGDVHLKAELLEQVGERAKLRFSVKNTGIGMTAEQAARLFQPFSQADASTTRKHGGTGLGLTICQRLVELMGGEIYRRHPRFLKALRVGRDTVRAGWHRRKNKISFRIGDRQVGDARAGVSKRYACFRKHRIADVRDSARQDRVLSKEMRPESRKIEPSPKPLRKPSCEPIERINASVS